MVFANAVFICYFRDGRPLRLLEIFACDKTNGDLAVPHHVGRRFAAKALKHPAKIDGERRFNLFWRELLARAKPAEERLVISPASSPAAPAPRAAMRLPR